MSQNSRITLPTSKEERPAHVHKWVFLREKYMSFSSRKLDVFFCEQCLGKREIPQE